MEPIETLEKDGRTVEIHYEEDGEFCDPRDADNFCTMVLFGKARSYGDEHDYRSEDYTGWDDMWAALEREHPRGVVLPVYVMDHGSIALSTTDFWFRAVDSAGWDWTQVGFAVVSAQDVRDNWGYKRISRKLRERAEELVRNEVELQGHYVNGECYYWSEVDADGEEIDSCGGFVGLDSVREGARMHLDL